MIASDLCGEVSCQHSDCKAGISEREEWGEDDGKNIIRGDGWFIREKLAGKLDGSTK